jgi:hypothetical protein
MALTLAFQPALVLLGNLGHQAYSVLERVEIWQRFYILAQP